MLFTPNPKLAILFPLISAAFVGASGYFAWMSARGDMAGARLDVFAAQPDNRAAQEQLAATQAMLVPPRDARLWGMEAARLQRVGGENASEAVDAALAKAVAMAPARASLRMQQAYAIGQSTDSTTLGQKLVAWHDVAPHDGETQPWRLALGVSKWDILQPEVRLALLADAEDVCVRSSKKRTLQLVQTYGQSSSQFGVASRLERMTRTCVVYPENSPPILPL